MIPLCASWMLWAVKAWSALLPMITHNAGMKAKDDPWNTGTIPLVQRWNSRVPMPAVNSATAGDMPVISGTNTVEPNIARVCCAPRATFFAFNSGRIIAG